MNIQTIKTLKNADQAIGITVVIDVLRAFTTTCYLFANGAKEIISVVDLEKAYAIKQNHPSYLSSNNHLPNKSPKGRQWKKSEKE